MDCLFGFVTETWYSDGDNLEQESEKLLLGNGIKVFTLNRPVGSAGFSHGGVAIVVRDAVTKMSTMDFPNPDSFEVLVVNGTMAGIKRKVFLICCYIPPGYTVPRGKSCLAFLSDIVLKIKRSCPTALICIGGDFNQWNAPAALVDYPELCEVITPPTRKNRRIDRVFLNWSADIVDSTCFPPLQAENDRGESVALSDHRIQFIATTLEKKEPVTWETYTYRPYTDTGADGFLAEIKKQGWDEVLLAGGSNAKSQIFQAILDDLMDRFFPKKTVRRRSSDLPWFNNVARKKVKKKRAVFRAEGRSERWKALRDDLDSYMSARKEIFLQKQRDKLAGPDAMKHFFKNVKSYKAFDKPKSFNVRDLRPNKKDADVADEVAAFFNEISGEFDPLQPSQVPSTYHRDLPRLSPSMVEDRLKKSKKTSSMVNGDLFPALINKCADSISTPLADIYNCILDTYVWPIAWKREFVTTIPKKKLPTDFSDLRNISCTLYFSKIFEAYVLQCTLEEISLKKNQFGGVKGCSTTHMIVELLQEICSNAEDYRSATVLTAIDYSKAFNRVSYQECLAAFKKKGSSSPILRLIATFLTNRTMSVRVGDSWSEPRDVTGGCPQGSILGVLLFNVTIEDLEEDFESFEAARRVRDEQPDSQQNFEARLEQDQEPSEPSTSSPTNEAPRPACPLSPVGGGVFRMGGARRVRVYPNVRNAPVAFIPPPLETKVGTQVLVLKPVKIFKYVDDNIICEKLNFGREEIVVGLAGRRKLRQAISSQNAFISITAAAMKKGMKVNESKTNLLCVSDSLNFKTLTYIEDTNGDRIDCVESMRVLGFYLSDRTGVAEHVKQTVKKMRQRYWVLYHLRALGFNEDELLRVYMSNILPIADYCCPAYHSLMSDIQDQELENAQIGALRQIYGYGLSARKLREKASLQTLRNRRVELTDKFARKCLSSERFKDWFPLKSGRASSRHPETYEEEFAKCDRLKNSPLFYMRRRLNGKDGKVYGQRNREYRE